MPTLDILGYQNALDTAGNQYKGFLESILFLDFANFGIFIPNYLSFSRELL